MDKLQVALVAAGIHLTSWYGSGAVAANLLKQHGIKQHCRPDDRDSEQGKATLSAYFGGRVETFAVGINTAPTYSYDIRSAYPAAIQHLPSLKGATWRYLNAHDRTLEHAIYHVRWRTQNQTLTPFPFRRAKRIWWPREGEGWYHAPEIAVALRYARAMRWEIEVVEGWALDTNGIRPFADWVPELYERRAAYKAAGNSAEKPLKLGLNSLYGKTAQSQSAKGREPPFRSFYWAGMITSVTRAQIMEAAVQAARTKHNLLAIATDALFTREPLTLDMGDALGQWESKELEPGLALLQPGVYATPTASVKRTRGFGHASFSYHEALIQWHRHRFDATLECPDTRFIGFGHALARGRLGGERNIWRTWQTGKRTITMGGTSTKTPDVSNDWREPLIWLLPPVRAADGASEPFELKVRSVEALRAMELDAASLAEQPDMWENDLTYQAG